MLNPTQHHLVISRQFCRFLSTSVHKYGFKSDDTITKSITDLWSKVLWYQVHLWASLCSKKVLIIDNPWVAQKSDNLSPLHKSGRPFLPITTPIISTWSQSSSMLTLAQLNFTQSGLPLNPSCRNWTKYAMYFGFQHNFSETWTAKLIHEAKTKPKDIAVMLQNCHVFRRKDTGWNTQHFLNELFI